MRPTSEDLFHLQEQPSNFCDSIDPTLRNVKAIYEKIHENIRSAEQCRSVGDSLLILDESYIPSSTCDFDDYDKLIRDMEQWAKGWLDILKNSIDKNTLNDAHKMFLENLVWDFDSEINAFTEGAYKSYAKMETAFNQIEVAESYYNNYIGDYNEISKDDNYVTEENENNIDNIIDDLVNELSDIESAYSDFDFAIEDLRGFASHIRGVVNDQLKIEAKKQLIFVEDENWYGFMVSWLQDHEIKNLNTQLEQTKKEMMQAAA